MNITISSGHGAIIRGAQGYIDEVDEARLVVDRVAEYLREVGVGVTVFHDDLSKTQDENLHRIVDEHNNSGAHDLDVSIHFNAYETTSKAMGTECLFVSQEDLAEDVAIAVSDAAGFINRGPKRRDDLYFLNQTNAPAILVEVCFVDSSADVSLYHAYFEEICAAIAGAIAGIEIDPPDRPPRRDGIEFPDLPNELVTIEGVKVYETVDGDYVCFVSDLDVCNDGTGPDYDDPSYQSQTAYYSGGVDGKGKYLNADKDKYIVIPPQVRSLTQGVVMGCQARLTNLRTGAHYDAVTGEIGPDYTTGEAAYCLAKIVNPSITHNSGDEEKVYLYELWPDVPAVVDGFTYKLQPA